MPGAHREDGQEADAGVVLEAEQAVLRLGVDVLELDDAELLEAPCARAA